MKRKDLPEEGLPDEKSPVNKPSKRRKWCIQFSEENTAMILKLIAENREEIDEDLRAEGKIEEEIENYWRKFRFKLEVESANLCKEKLNEIKKKNREKAAKKDSDEEFVKPTSRPRLRK